MASLPSSAETVEYRCCIAAVSTWARLVCERGWLRPGRRLYPAKAREGNRASRPNEYWHLVVTVIKLLDGTRTYLHVAIDNFSRHSLAWKLALRLEPKTTCQLLAKAAKHLPAGSDATSVVADSGVENVNQEVNAWFASGPLRRVLAQVEVSFSNSMIEVGWRSSKHGWLYLHQLETSLPWRSSSPSMWSSTTAWFRMRHSPARRQMRCIWVVATTFPASLPPATRAPEQLAWNPTGACLAEPVGRQS